MHVCYAQLVKRPAVLHRLVGLNVAEFEQLLEAFAVHYHQQVIQPRLSAPERIRALGAGQKGALPTVADKLLFILVYSRMYPLLIVQGMLFGMVESKACTWVGRLLPVLDAALGQLHVRPKRAKGHSLEELIEAFPELKELGVLTDGTERPIRRPKDVTQQKENYSGKKKRHTRKHVTLTHPQTQSIVAVSEEAPGSRHDKKILDEAQLSCTSGLLVQADTGFQGLEIGNAGFKRHRSVSDILRNTRQGMSDLLAMVAMGLHNLRVMLRASYQMA